MNLKSRECPNCHRLVSIKTCSTYFLHGTSRSVHCNHCDTELMLPKEPIPFKWCVFAGFVCGVVPAEYFLYIRQLGLSKSLLYATLIGLLGLVVCMILILNKIYFKKVLN